jgi:hypothetical protein
VLLVGEEKNPVHSQPDAASASEKITRASKCHVRLVSLICLGATGFVFAEFADATKHFEKQECCGYTTVAKY